MITHNGKQVTLAMRNRKAINLIARNGKAMFGEYAQWLTGIDAAAKAVILAEYGKQVWSDVRDYAKAHPQIVEFINQDPHLACSISPNSNKERWLVGDGKAYINTGVKSSATTIFEMKLQYLETVGSTSQFNGIYDSDHRVQIGTRQQGFGIGYGSLYIDTSENKPYVKHSAKLDCKQKKGYDNGKEYSFASATFNANKKFDIYLFARWRGDQNLVDAICKEMVAYAAIDDHTFIPHLTADGQCGMLDLVNLTFHPNANTQGAFTIAITDKE